MCSGRITENEMNGMPVSRTQREGEMNVARGKREWWTTTLNTDQSECDVRGGRERKERKKERTRTRTGSVQEEGGTTGRGTKRAEDQVQKKFPSLDFSIVRRGRVRYLTRILLYEGT